MNDMTSLKWLRPITFSVVSFTYRKTRLLIFSFDFPIYNCLPSARVAICQIRHDHGFNSEEGVGGFSAEQISDATRKRE